MNYGIFGRESTYISTFVLIFTILSITFYLWMSQTDLWFTYGEISLKDPNLKVELVVDGLKNPTGMAFLKDNDFLVLEKDNGTVLRVFNGKVMDSPIIDLSVANKYERGLLGIATSGKDNSLPKYVFLFFSESKVDGNDICPYVTHCDFSTNPIGNRLYRYEYKQGGLESPKLLLDLPSAPGADHVGGYLSIGPDNNIYITSGDGDSCFDYRCEGYDNTSVVISQTSNFAKGAPPEGRGGILRVDQDGNPVLNEDGNGIIGDNYPLNLYYAYGLRNGFGLDFDPITGKLWDTENGPTFGDEINLVEEGFNSGWAKFQGVWHVNENNSHPLGDKGYSGSTLTPINDFELVDFNGKGEYSPPEFVWNHTVGVTTVRFLNSDNLGKGYENDLFVADYNHNNIYNFDLNSDRTGLELKGLLEDNIANNYEELKDIIFASGFGAISDMQIGPDGYLYIVSYTSGAVYKIVPVEDTS